MNIANLLVRSARTFPNSPAIFHGDKLICNYCEFAERAARLGGGLSKQLNLAPGERVAIFMINAPEYLEIIYGIAFAGLVAVPINAKLHQLEAAQILKNSGAKALFASDELMTGFSPLGPPCPDLNIVFIPGTAEYQGLLNCPALSRPVARDPEDLAWLFYTSGTTGAPKGVMQTHGNLLAMTMCSFTDVDTAKREDAIIYAAPMSHGAGMCNFSHILVAARHVIPESGGFAVEELINLAATHQRCSMFAAPTMVKRLVEHIVATGADASSFKTIIYGGGPMYLEDIRRALEVMGDRFVQLYGQAESPFTITALSRYHLTDNKHPRYLQRIASVGVAQSMVEVRVTDDQGRTLPKDEIGEVVVRGATVMKGYWNNIEATQETIRGGWLFTGDMGSMDEDGFLTLRDRSKDVIISGGANIYPREVEEVLLLHPAVKEVSVVGRRHPDWGEEVVAFIVLRSNAAVPTQEFDNLCLERIARFKRPKSYRFVIDLPKNNYGKVLKTSLRQQLQQELDLDSKTQQ
jgi:long-chain acyl-CoA synthetase